MYFVLFAGTLMILLWALQVLFLNNFYGILKSSQTKTVKGINRTQLTLKNLQSQTTYYVRIRTYRKVSGVLYYSAWSKTKEIRTK